MAKSVLFTTTGHRVPDSIREIERLNRLALDAGMSYGRYVAAAYVPLEKPKRRGKKRAE